MQSGHANISSWRLTYETFPPCFIGHSGLQLKARIWLIAEFSIRGLWPPKLAAAVSPVQEQNGQQLLHYYTNLQNVPRQSTSIQTQ